MLRTRQTSELFQYVLKPFNATFSDQIMIRINFAQRETICSRRRWTSPPVPPPGELYETYALILIHLLHYVKT